MTQQELVLTHCGHGVVPTHCADCSDASMTPGVGPSPDTQAAQASIGRELAEAGMQRAIEGAQAETAGAFSKAALQFLVEFATRAGRPVSLPEVRMAARGVVPDVREPRAWGSIPLLARKRGYLAPAGYVASPDPTSHSRPCVAWRWTGKVFAAQGL